jgi:hypothetical protein
VGDGEKLLKYFNSVLKVVLRTDIFPRVPKKVKFCCPVKYVNIHIFSPLEMTGGTKGGAQRARTLKV